jgi:hypothetical protein
MTNHKSTPFADYEEFAAYIATIPTTTTIQVVYSEKKGWVVVE